MSLRRELRLWAENDRLKRQVAKQAREVEAVPRLREELRVVREQARVLRFNNAVLARFIPAEDRECAWGFVETLDDIEDTDVAEVS